MIDAMLSKKKLVPFYCDNCGEQMGWTTRWSLNEVFCQGHCAEANGEMEND